MCVGERLVISKNNESDIENKNCYGNVGNPNALNSFDLRPVFRLPFGSEPRLASDETRFIDPGDEF